jgi:hypothetical protein
MAPEFIEQKTKPDFRDGVPFSSHCQRTLGVQRKCQQPQDPCLPHKQLILVTAFHVEGLGSLGAAVDKLHIDFERFLELEELIGLSHYLFDISAFEALLHNFIFVIDSHLSLIEICGPAAHQETSLKGLVRSTSKASGPSLL